MVEAADGAAAVQICVAHQGTIHLMLTDVIMPGMNGRELAQRVSEIRPNMKVLYMSGYTENAIGHNGTLDAGITLLQKPFTLHALKAKVREVLDKSMLPLEVAMSARAVIHTEARVPREKVPRFRAQRFNLHLPLRYREVGEQGWRQGTTSNISRSGLLFNAEEVLQPNAQLEINLVLPAEIAGLSPTEVVCRGEVVRSVEGKALRRVRRWRPRFCSITSNTAPACRKRKHQTGRCNVGRAGRNTGAGLPGSAVSGSYSPRE